MIKMLFSTNKHNIYIIIYYINIVFICKFLYFLYICQEIYLYFKSKLSQIILNDKIQKFTNEHNIYIIIYYINIVFICKFLYFLYIYFR